MDEHQCQNQSFTVTLNFRHQPCWYGCLWPAEGTFFKLGSHLSLIQGQREEALWIYEQLPMSGHSSCIYNQAPSHFSLTNI